MNKILILSTACLFALASSCKKEKPQDNTSSGDIQKSVLNDYANIICYNTYGTLAAKTQTLYADVQAFTSSPDEAGLAKCRADWRNAREIWESSEAWLFGPVSTDAIDPRIDTWPVDFVRLDSVMSSANTLNESYINSLEESLKGFHPIEYMLFGLNGNKKAADFTAREKEYLLALSDNLMDLTANLKHSWDPAGGNYMDQLVNAGSSTDFPTRKSAYEQMVGAMIDICDEVANGKINEVFISLDSMGEESPFAKNSITDFTNNIKGVKYAYLSTFGGSDGKGLEDIVRQYNLSLDGNIKQKMDAAIGALSNITDPFGRAIHTQPIQVQSAIDAINALKDELDGGLLPLVQQHIN